MFLSRLRSVSLTSFQHHLSSLRRLLHHKYLCNMDKAYLRYLDGAERFELTFQYAASEPKINRQFNMSRSSSESISNFLGRVSANVEKKIKKKNRKEGLAIVASLSDDGGNEIDGSALCKDVFKPDRGVVLRIMESEYQVVINSPFINSMALPTNIMAGFPVYPTKFDAVYTDLTLSEFAWSTSKDKEQWTKVGDCFMYPTKNSDIDSYLQLRLVPKNAHFEGPGLEVESNVTISASPGLCPFELRHRFTTSRCQGESFRVVTYNILADLYCDSDYTRQVLHPYCPPYALSMDYRKQLIIKELLGYNADIILLQEVDRRVFNNDLQVVFNQLGYECDLCLKGKEVAEGLACIFDRNRFRKLESHRFVPSEQMSTDPIFADIWDKIATNEGLATRILERSTALQVTVVESLDKNEVLVLANTHLYFHPDADHIRLLQAGIIIRYIESLVKSVKENVGDKRVSLLVCGDFNSVPECGIYELFTTGKVPEDHVDFSSNTEQAVRGIELAQGFILKSACGTPPFTNFTAGFAACLDYIFFEEGNLEVAQVIPLPSHEELTANTALPSVVFPSDHISLVSDLKWK